MMIPLFNSLLKISDPGFQKSRDFLLLQADDLNSGVDCKQTEYLSK